MFQIVKATILSVSNYANTLYMHVAACTLKPPDDAVFLDLLQVLELIRNRWADIESRLGLLFPHRKLK